MASRVPSVEGIQDLGALGRGGTGSRNVATRGSATQRAPAEPRCVADAPLGAAEPTRPAGGLPDRPGWSRYGTARLLDERGELRPFDALEAEVIRFAVDHYRGQMSEVARRLGIGRSTLYRKLKDYGIGAAATP